jgi:hypothetical protein
MSSSAPWAPRLCCCKRAPRTKRPPRWRCCKRAPRTKRPPRWRCCDGASGTRAGSLWFRCARRFGPRTRRRDTWLCTRAWRSRSSHRPRNLRHGASPAALGWCLASGSGRCRRILAVHHQNLADVLHRLCSQASAYRRQHRFALVPVGVGHAHFDQLVALEVEVDLAEDRLGEALVSHQHHRVQRMGTGLERLARERCELHIIHRMPLKAGF